jgi:hypothetical protein
MSARTRPYVLAAAAVVLASAAGLAGCSSDDEGGADSLPPVVTTAAPSSTLPATPTPTTVAPVTAAPTTQAPTTIAPTTSSTSTTTSTTVAETTTSTTTPRSAALVLRDDGLGDALFGAETDEVIAYVRSIIGAPTADTGWVDPFSVFGVCPGTEVRGVTWGDLTLLFSDSSTVTSGRRHFFHYSYGPPFGSTIEPAGMRTSTGVGVGSTIAELRAGFPGVVVNPADDIFDANFYVSDTFRGFVSGTADTDLVTSIAGGVGCGE